jgi:hypothetical protein
MIRQRAMAGGFLLLVRVGVANTVLNVLVGRCLFATVNAAACLVALWAACLIYVDAE